MRTKGSHGPHPCINRIKESPAAQIPMRIDGETMISVCIFGDPNSEPLLGRVTLEEFGAVVY
ncbi:MAG: hypothetical protein KAU14_10300 [Thermoplasmata archaeon]|nr:hypothetical protein [Thermoplasmata archaeon]